VTSRELVRTALILGAVYLMISACAGGVASIAGAVSAPLATGAGFGDALGSLGFAAVATFLFVASFGLLPGLYVLSSRDDWARRLTPDSDQAIQLSPGLVLGVAAMILGISFGVEGLVSFAFAFVMAAASPGGDALVQTWVGSTAGGVVYLIAGVWIFRWGRSGVTAGC
jgi:hypothetical protein